MSTYKRCVKFYYYKVAKVKIEENAEEVLGKFNLIEWLMDMEDQAKVKHNIKLSDTSVNLEEYSRYSNENIWAIRAYKLRDANVPSKIKDGEDAQPIPLESDEYIGEDINFLYDRENSICMFQQNRMSIGVSKLCEWINKICSMEESCRVVFLPIYDRLNKKRFEKKEIRSVDFSFANLEPDNESGSLGQIIKAFHKYNMYTGHVTLSVGRQKGAELEHASAMDLIDDLHANPGIVNSAKVKLKSISVSEDDKPRIEVVDLFENSIHDDLEFEIELKKPLDFSVAKAKMYEKYMERRDQLMKLCKW